MNDEFTSVSKIMEQFFGQNLNASSMNLPNVWRKVLLSIKNYNDTEEISFGEKLANNSHIVDLKNGVLLVEANHPGWIQYLKMYQKYILKGLKMSIPDLEFKNLAFRVAGSNVQLSDLYEEKLKKDQKIMNEKIEEQEKILDQKFSNKNKENKQNKGLPPELIEKFESIKKSMLTNSDK